MSERGGKAIQGYVFGKAQGTSPGQMVMRTPHRWQRSRYTSSKKWDILRLLK